MPLLGRAFVICFIVVAVVDARQSAPPEEPTYRVATEVTIAGAVTRVFTHVGQRGTPRVRATVSTEDGPVDIHLGPTSFISEKGMDLVIGDQVTLTGSKSPAGLVIVRRITRGTVMLDVRNDAGRPLWEDRHR